jgi:hypothetical protein
MMITEYKECTIHTCPHLIFFTYITCDMTGWLHCPHMNKFSNTVGDSIYTIISPPKNFGRDSNRETS